MGEDGTFEDSDDLFCSSLEAPYDEAEWGNVCDDFMDPLEKDVSGLIARFPDESWTEHDVACWLSDVTTGLAGLGDLGPEAFVERRRRSLVELAMTVSQEFAAEFEARATEIFERAYDLDDRFLDLTVDQLRGELWKFSHVDLAEFRSFLSHCSLTLRQMLGDRPKSAAGSEQGASGLTEQDVAVVRTWLADVKGDLASVAAIVRQEAKTPPANSRTTRRRKKTDAELAIRRYLAERQAYYDSLKPGCQERDPVAYKQAKALFGRNVLAKKLGLPPASVSGTDAWKKIRADLFSDPTVGGIGNSRRGGHKIGLDIAEEAAGKVRGDQTFDTVIRNETLDLIKKAKILPVAKEQMVTQLETGATSDADIRFMLESCLGGEEDKHADISEDE